MKDTNAANKRIARNSILMSVRMVIVLLISVYTTRAVLAALGVIDYGVFNVVCGFVAMFAFLNSSMTSATQRYYNYEKGKNGVEGIRKVYNASVIIHFILALLIVLVVEFVGLWYVENKLVVPIERMTAAIWIFHFSLAALFFNIINVPYSAVIMAYERMDYYSYVGVADAVLKLVIVYILYCIDTDKLVLYGFFILLIIIFNYLAYRIYAKRNFKELTLGLKPSKSFLGEMLSYAGWNLFGSFAYMMRDHGINLLLNAFFGPVVNAAKGVTNQVNGALQGFANNIITPARPQIVQSYAKADYERTFRLLYSVSKLSCIAFLLMSLPICLLIKPILSFWLGTNVPEHASSFIIIMLITNTWGSLVAPVSAVVHATGKMRFYQLLSSASNLMTVPLAYVFLLYDDVPEYAFYALLITVFTNHGAGLISLLRLTVFSLGNYIKNVIVPLIFVIVLSVFTTFLAYYYIENTILNFVGVLFISTISISIYSYLICFDKSEKQMIIQIINKVRHR